mmetsp:Transcript_19244/g.30502  ORF Transcript_19244/g.30502 Transcript_19244/m.30502 type:complete len:367 (-) Transcript_19244:159-1259(-)|eukprot:CAMPEP_0197024436 /NCGR_PEP_ID=MMETSP1384-20130603/4971_1 /TAXON_ID=29189 /ORGANISM="Ammonia sp." /LENGTH=366 /DNA_ID=CAMNT_0042452819 /DNA_START=54 /DNA_END=1154 /DNA_ORIENTATION=+
MHRIQKITNHLSADSASTKLTKKDTSGCPSCPAPYNRPAKVLVTGAAGNIAYAILFGIGRGKLLGPNQQIELYLLDIPMMADKMKGVVMELQDCAFPLFTKIISTTDYKTAFTDIDVALLIGARPRGPGMVRADLLTSNANIFKGQGEAIEKYASRDVKVVVVGNPANTNALIAMKNAPSIPPSNFTAMTRLDQNRAMSQIADKIGGVGVDQINNVIIWGNHSATQYPDISHGYLTCKKTGKPVTSLRAAINDEYWIDNTFISTVQKRGKAIIEARGLSSAASAANACLDHVRDWLCGSDGRIVSMAVPSKGNPYGIDQDIIYSFPVTCSDGNFSFVKLPVSMKSFQRMKKTEQELLDEKKVALAI